MDDIVDRLREGVCNPNTGCLPKICGCAAMDEAADCIEELREQLGHEKHVLKETQEGWELLHTQNKRLRERIAELDGFIKTIEEQIVALEEDNRKLRVEAGYD